MNKIFEKENNPHWYVDLCIEGKVFFDYHQSLMSEINRREGNYGKNQSEKDKKTKDGETKTAAEIKKEKEEEEKKREEEKKVPFNPYKLEIPAYIKE